MEGGALPLPPFGGEVGWGEGRGGGAGLNTHLVINKPSSTNQRLGLVDGREELLEGFGVNFRLAGL